MDCKWGDWQDWGECDKCGGQKRRFRHLKHHASCGGTPCTPDAAEMTAKCDRACHAKTYCGFGEWKDWGECSATCGPATRERVRLIVKAAEHPVEARFLTNNIHGISGLSESFGQESIETLKTHTDQLELRRLQEQMVAFVCGGVSLIALFLTYRLVARCGSAGETRADATSTRSLAPQVAVE
jgi:hypothetical protein